ncbi:MAG: hypothetical protein RL479_1267, partial [Verrucomicrobiota bacterium]
MPRFFPRLPALLAALVAPALLRAAAPAPERI